MRCCYSGPHECGTCGKTFMCEGGAGGLMGRVYANYPVYQEVCDGCFSWVTKPSYCRTCFKSFPSSNSLHRHLRMKTSHMRDPWEKCPVCEQTSRWIHPIKALDAHVYGCFRMKWRTNLHLQQLFKSTGNLITESFYQEELVRKVLEREAEKKRLDELKERLSNRKVRYFNRGKKTSTCRCNRY